MINEKNSRTINLIGEENFNKLKNFRVAVFGIGGVGGFALEALARSGIGEIDIIDSDNIDISNINRQIIALEDTIDMSKDDIAESRIKSINQTRTIYVYDIINSSSYRNTCRYDR